MRITELKTQVNKEKGVVTAIAHMEITPDIPILSYHPNLGYQTDLKTIKIINQYKKGKEAIVALAKCNPTDTFNEELGIKLAIKRVKIKCFQKAYQIYQEIITIKTREVQDLERYATSLKDSNSLQKENINKYLKTL